MANNNWYVKISANGTMGVVELDESNGRPNAWRNEIWCESIKFLVGNLSNEHVMIVDAEGKFNAGQDYNELASKLFGSAQYNEWIYGDALVGRVEGETVFGFEQWDALEMVAEFSHRLATGDFRKR